MLVWHGARARVVALVTSAVATASLLLVQFVLAGFGNAFHGMVTQPVFDLRGGRRLPIPPSWSTYDGYLQDLADGRPRGWPLPTLAGPHQLFLWFFATLVAIALLVGTGIWAMRNGRPSADPGRCSPPACSRWASSPRRSSAPTPRTSRG